MQMFTDFDKIDAEIENQTTAIANNIINLKERMENVHLGTIAKNK